MSKSKKHLRDCPAVGHPITSAECGTNRGSHYRCPEDCPFFPFNPANYDQQLEIEERLIAKTYERAAKARTMVEAGRLPEGLGASGRDAQAHLASHARFVYHHHWRRDAQGHTFAERWLADPQGGLNNDERVLLAGVSRIRPVLLEVQRIVDEHTVEGVDLLDGRPLRICERATASTVGRYSVLLAWVYPLAYYERLSGSAAFLPEVAGLAPEEILRETIRHLGGPSDSDGERAWLAEHFTRTCEALSAVKSARWLDTLNALDGRYIKTNYRLSPPADRLRTLLVQHPGMREEPLAQEETQEGFTEGFVWLETPDAPASRSASPPKLAAKTPLGRVLLGPDRVRIETMTQPAHQALRQRFEALARGLLKFVDEQITDLAQSIRTEALDFDAALVAPRLRENPQQIGFTTEQLDNVPAGDDTGALTAAFQQQYATFADEPLEILEGRTARAAAQDPALRPKLVSLMKSHLRGCDQRRREEGLDVDLNPLLAELGLDELISEPPPVGMGEEEEGDEWEGDDEWEGEGEPEEDVAEGVFGSLLHGGLAPVGPFMPALTGREIDLRLGTFQKRYPDAKSAAEAMERDFPGLLEVLWEMGKIVLSEAEFSVLQAIVVRACHELRPPVGPAPTLDLPRLKEAIGRELTGLAVALATSGIPRQAALDRWLEATPQPVVMEDLVGTVFSLSDRLPGKSRPSEKGISAMFAILKGLVAEFSRAQA